MPAPSLTVEIGDRGPAAPAPGDVGAWFAAGLFDRGPVGSVTQCLSLAAVKAVYGDVVSYSHMIREAEAYFRESGGVGRMLVSRLVGPSATKGQLALSSAVPAVVTTVVAANAGAWSTELTITVTTGAGSVRNVVLEQDGQVVMTGAFSTTAELEDALEATGLVTCTTGVGVWPIAAIAETALSAGTDDRASIPTTAAGWTTELAVFNADLGSGTVSLPGVTTPAAHEALAKHFWSHKRFPLLDGLDTATVVSLTAPAATLRALGPDVALGQILVPWITVPGPGLGTVTIPPSGAVAGRMALADRENTAGPAQPAAGRFGVLRWAQDVTQEWTQADRDTLSEAGVTVIRNIDGAVQPYDDRSFADPATWPQYDSVGALRVTLAIYQEAKTALAPYVLRLIDGPGHIYVEAAKDLIGICQEWFARDALFGTTPDEAFSVVVGPGLAPRSLEANLVIRPGESVNTVALRITLIDTTDTI